MNKKSMTALVSGFARAFHSENYQVKVFDDTVAKKLLSQEEYQAIGDNMSGGIGFFNPNFKGTKEEALKWVVNHQLAPTPVGRAAFAVNSLENDVKIGAEQYLIFAAGYETFAYNQPSWANKLEIFEIDYYKTAEDKKRRLKKAEIDIPQNTHFVNADFNEADWSENLVINPFFKSEKKSFCSLLGLSYYLTCENFHKLLCDIAKLVPKGSTMVFDYPAKAKKQTEQTKKQEMLAKESDETMLSRYSYREMEFILSKSGWLIYDHLTPEEITKRYFSAFNNACPNDSMKAFDNVNYCLAVKN